VELVGTRGEAKALVPDGGHAVVPRPGKSVEIGDGRTRSRAIYDALSEGQTAGGRAEFRRIGHRCTECPAVPVTTDEEVKRPATGAAQLERARGDTVALIGQGGDGVLQEIPRGSIPAWALVRCGLTTPHELMADSQVRSLVGWRVSRSYG
jgi:hypothetical protein